MNAVKELTLTSDAPGAKLFMLGNEAIARGAIEAGVQVVAAYPGTPSSEITETLHNMAKEIKDMYVEWSVNEKVAFEVAFGASMAGLRGLAIMKHVGVNVAHDPFIFSGYSGAVGSLVLISADDPGQWSSQCEQHNGYIAEQAFVPILEPSSIQEAKDMMADAIRLSEKFSHPFMLRTVTRISHARGDVALGEITKDKKTGVFKREPRLICMPAWSRPSKVQMLDRFARIREFVETMSCNQLRLVKNPGLGIIASGVSYGYTVEALQWLGLEDKVSVFKVGTPHPLPVQMTTRFLRSVPEALVIEELDPFVENHVKIIAQEAGLNVKIHGKDLVSGRLELSTRQVAEVIARLLGVKTPIDFGELSQRAKETEPLLPFRPPTLCSGCPHRASFHAINVAAKKVSRQVGMEAVYSGDIGCYSLGVYPPLEAYHTSACMGGGFGIALGLARAVKNPVIGHLGDSTFFHSGIPPLIDAVFNQTKVTLVVLDNSTTAMTGFQPHPGSSEVSEDRRLKPEDIARACGVKFIEVLDPFELKKTVDVLEKAIKFEGPSFVVLRAPCDIQKLRMKRQKGEKVIPYRIDQEKCTQCKLCINSLGCPAILLTDDQVSIDNTLCTGCSLCAQVCPVKAIVEDRG